MRLGNHLTTYVKTKWNAYQNDIPFLLTDFLYADHLNLSLMDPRLENLNEILLDYKKIILKKVSYSLSIEQDILYQMIFDTYLGTDLIQEIKSDPFFYEEIKKAISPIDSLELIYPPENIASVAVHIRKGGGYDPPLKSVQIFNLKYPRDLKKKPDRDYIDKKFPLKFPPEQFYIDQIKNLSKILGDEPLYVFIFTDVNNPVELKKRIEKEVGLENITFDCRIGVAGHDINVLEDLFSLGNFENMICAGYSTFCHISQLLNDYDILIYPTAYHWKKDKKNREYLVMGGIKVEGFSSNAID